MKTKLVYELFIAFALFSCRMTDQPETGYWRAGLVPDSTRPALEIPFLMEITRSVDKSFVTKIMNAGEVISVKEVIIQEDSIHLRLPVFEGKVAGTKMMLSAFDGAHALVFQVRERENTTRK